MNSFCHEFLGFVLTDPEEDDGDAGAMDDDGLAGVGEEGLDLAC